MQNRNISESVTAFFNQDAEEILKIVVNELGRKIQDFQISDFLLEDIKLLKNKYSRNIEFRSSDSPRTSAMKEIEEFKNLIELEINGKNGACYLVLHDHLSFEQVKNKEHTELATLAKQIREINELEGKVKSTLDVDACNLFNLLKRNIPTHLAACFMTSTILRGEDYLKLYLVTGVDKFYHHLTTLTDNEFTELVNKQQSLENEKKSHRRSYNFSSLGREIAIVIERQISERLGESQVQAL